MSTFHTENIETRDGIGEVEFYLYDAQKGSWDEPGIPEDISLDKVKWQKYDDEGEIIPQILSIEDLASKEIEDIIKAIQSLIADIRRKYNGEY